MNGWLTAFLAALFAIAYVVGHAVASITNIAVIRELRTWIGTADSQGPDPPPNRSSSRLLRLAVAVLPTLIIALPAIGTLAYTIVSDTGNLTDRAADEALDRGPAAVAAIEDQLDRAGLDVPSSVVEDAVVELLEAPPLFSASALEGVVSKLRQDNPELADDVEAQIQSPTELLAASVAAELGLPAEEITNAIIADRQVAEEIQVTLDLAVVSKREAALSEIEERAALGGMALVTLSVFVLVGGLLSTLMLFRVLGMSRLGPDKLKFGQGTGQEERRSNSETRKF